MKIYGDLELKNEIQNLHFGKVEVGKRKELMVFLHNDSKAVLANLKFSLKGKENLLSDVKILRAPLTMQPGSIAALVLEWVPDLKLKEALDLEIEVEGEEIYLSAESVTREKV